MKEMYLRLPLVEIGSDPEEVYQAKHYRKSGRYIIRRSNGDVSVADVQIREVGVGEARPTDERTLNVYETFVGQPELFDPDDWVLATDLENAQNAYESKIESLKKEMQADRERHEAEMAEQKEKCEAVCRETEENCDKLIKEKEAELQYRIDTLSEADEQKLAMRRMELEQEYEKKKLQLELETPKRFAQGEWVSGKTLTEIIKTLAGKNESIKREED
jgi:hypothetical protein